MATLILTTVGSAIGGPVGGAIGAAIGQQVDLLVFKPKSREGPRLQELAVQTSSYGNQIPAIFGAMRVAGTVIWATDLIERRAKTSGGKGRPSTVNYSYSVSLCVALSSSPILRIGRIWADGNLLRGETGDLKVDTQLRIHLGHPDQMPDPLIASAESAGRCPANRGLAYAVFEDLQLADFGNRIPSLTFEIFERDGLVPVSDIFKAAVAEQAGTSTSQTVNGFALAGATARDPLLPLLETLSIKLGIRNGRLAIEDFEARASSAYDVTELAAENDSRFEPPRQIAERSSAVPNILGLRYYDAERDFLASLQQSQLGSVAQSTEQFELPVVLTAAKANQIVHTRHVQIWNSNRRWLADVASGADKLSPGDEVTDAFGKTWQIEQIEHRFGSAGISARAVSAQAMPGDQRPVAPGRNISSPDLTIGQTWIALIDLPVFGTEDPGSIALAVFAAGTGAGWRRAALARRLSDELFDIGITAAPATIGTSLDELPSHNVSLIDEGNGLRVQLLNSAMVMPERFGSPLDPDAPICWLGNEFIRFGKCQALGNNIYHLSRLQRGCFGLAAISPIQLVGQMFVRIEADTARLLELSDVAQDDIVTLEASGLADDAPATASATAQSLATVPPSPIHARATRGVDGTLALHWVRRSRIDLGWRDGVEQAMVEGSEQYAITLLADGGAIKEYITGQPSVEIDSAEWASLAIAENAMITAEVRQIGKYSQSLPLIIPII